MSDVEELESVAEFLKHSESDPPNLELKYASSPREYIDSPTEPSDATCDREQEKPVEILTQVPQEGKPFAVECELDFEDEAESGLDKNLSQIQALETKIVVDILKSKNRELSDDEDGQCTPEKIRQNPKGNKTDESSTEEGEDDGECTDGDDLEEGELKEENGREDNATKPLARQICRFYNRGQCFYGNVCRFLHVNFDKTGNYNMFAPAPRLSFNEYDQIVPLGNICHTPHGMINHRSGPRSGPDFMPPSAPPTPLPPPLPPVEPAAVESAWERGLREAKELVKKANKRKEEEPDFEEKRLNLSLVVNEKNVPEFDKENDCNSYKREKKKRNDGNVAFKYDDSHEAYDNEYEARSHWRDGRFENFEIRYTREDRRDRGSRGRMDRERDKIPKPRMKERWRDDRLQQVQSRSSRVEEFFDPWRRSKSPKGNRRTRSRSFSSVSSYSYSDRSSRSHTSCSFSHSSSPSSRGSSRSPVQQKRKTSPPTATTVSPKAGPNKFNPLKKKPGAPRTSSSRSRSISRTPSISRSRSYSRSISMDSVSSASSSVSHSSSGSGSLGHRNSHASVLRKQEEKPDVDKIDLKPTIIPTVYQELPPRINKLETQAESLNIGINEDERDPLEEQFQMPLEVAPFPSLQHLLPTTEKAKEPVKGLHKQQIKLTLLNKNPQSKVTNLPKKELDVTKRQTDEPLKVASFQLGIKRPLSPPAPTLVAKPAPVLIPKKSASSRRDELLKQLKAVEDAIARKRAKFC